MQIEPPFFQAQQPFVSTPSLPFSAPPSENSCSTSSRQLGVYRTQSRHPQCLGPTSAGLTCTHLTHSLRPELDLS
ncbi:hypothetical protein CGCSCA4_v009635 [Colletotrichum siamense]|uniref:Uncharacterized protein n=1 Tax=Colletotrichum siamense TaxID=690259 RepID=A0A9P5F2T4_COLSI|nr:uncharacterized protein CGCS363_v010957 [Colletotrichum siamense]KAF4841136.1 hypothetical protein CGCSCA4_v009635 [Colletotrichum siamense]KAF4865327.1 hypothetical protein CGCSCA2_v001310 [Colletotrichum siamense]KAF5492132.1 hypothetical protein CGCS363_v010957 [Colletotrichum siamense]